MSTASAVTSFSPGSGARVQPRAHLDSSAESLDLSGAWRFALSPTADGAGPGAAEVEFDDSGWDTIAVPSHWVLEGGGRYGAFGRYGAPAYQNLAFPFPVDVPHVPDENPTGDYRTTFELTAAHIAEVGAGGSIYLRTLGIESLGIISVNGTEVGAVRGSRLTQELDISDVAVEGTNTLHVRVHQWSAHSYLEDQDQWWLPGIFREVRVIVRPARGIEDLWLRADFARGGESAGQGVGTLIPEIHAGRDAYPITLEVPELGISETWAEPEAVAPIRVGTVDPWSADAPRLYDVSVSNGAETLRLRAGFRRIEIRGDQWLVNGKRLRLRGVNRHEYDPDHGRVWDRDKAREGMLLMKRHNINAIRTAHYPPHPEFFDLADELGFWVMDECDYEAHGFEAGGWVDVPANDPRWRDALLDRVERFFERDKNHPSIISFSLGNEGHTGVNMAAMATWLHRRDPERPVHYEPDFDGAYTDLVSRMYPPLEEMRQMSAGEGRGRAEAPGRNAVLATRPMILCEYAHAMGNGPGGLAGYEHLFSSWNQWHGGFLWEWRDHGIRTRDAEGREFFGYGGDFGEEIHDGSFVCDGLVLSSGEPSPGLHEFGAIISPLTLTVSTQDDLGAGESSGEVPLTDSLTLEVHDERHAGSIHDFSFVVIDELDGEEVARHVLPRPHVWVDAQAGDGAAAEWATWPLPGFDLVGRSSGELWRTVSAVLREDTAWAKAGHEVAFLQVRVVRPSETATPSARTLTALGAPAALEGADGSTDQGALEGTHAGTPEEDPFVLGDAQFDPTTGDLVRLGDLDLAGPRLLLWRAPTENDSLSDFGSYILGDPTTTLGHGVPGPSTAALWEADGLNRLHRRVIRVDAGDGEVRALHRYAPAASRAFVDVELSWRLGSDGAVQLSADAQPSAHWSHPWARLGLAFETPLGAGDVSWFGTGPGESYADSRQAARVGRFSAPVADLVTEYAVPQESGYRPDLRELTLDGLGLVVRTEAVGQERPGFQVREHSAWEVAAAKHPHELPAPSATHLVFDLAQHGLGSRSCGPDVRPEAQLRPRPGAWSMSFGRVQEAEATAPSAPRSVPTRPAST